MPERFGNRPTIYPRLRRWAAAGLLDRVIQALQAHRLIRIRAEWVGLGSARVKVHPRWDGRAPKNRPQAIGRSRSGWTTKIHLVAAKKRTALTFARSPGQ
ncbi:MAG TPA: IS5/IS1182 family transposase, partial [Geminicoccaceae bacterium]